MKKLLILDRDGTIIEESPDQMLNELYKFRFLNGALIYLSKIATELDFEFVMITNQDGLGTDSFPEKEFWPLHEFFLHTMDGIGVHFDSINIDRHFPEDNSPFRKPGTAMLSKYLTGNYDLTNSIVVGDRWSDMELAKNLKAKGILLPSAYSKEPDNVNEIKSAVAYRANDWKGIYNYLLNQDRKSRIERNTNETRIKCKINLDGSGINEIDTGLAFFDHMLEQISRHGNIDLFISVDGDLMVDEHHTIEDTAIVLGTAIKNALGKKAGIQRYGFYLPMDECLAHVALDFGGRPWLVWEAAFKREKIGDVPTEMFYHFFKSFADNSACNLNIKVEGTNEHHMIESIFKAFAKSLRMAVRKNVESMEIPSTKGSL